MHDRERLIQLNLVTEIGSLRLTRLLTAFGDLRRLFRASEEQLREVEGIGTKIAARIAAVCRDPEALPEELELAERAGCAIVTQLDAGYPEPLRDITDPPPVLYMKGAWIPADAVDVAIVGARRSTLYGQQTATRLAADLARRGVTIVSGLARGIDAAAHRGALAAGGRTIAVVGNGLASVYPPEHDGLAAKIAERGAVISEYPATMPPLPHHFPRRNRLISGLSLGVVVVEAGPKSGALITADCALDQGREVFAVPGKVDSEASQGAHRLLKQGARLVTSVDDIIEELRLEAQPLAGAHGEMDDVASGAMAGARAEQIGDASDDERRLLSLLQRDEPSDVDELAVRAGVPVAACSTALVSLSLKRLVRQLPGQQFVRAA